MYFRLLDLEVIGRVIFFYLFLSPGRQTSRSVGRLVVVVAPVAATAAAVVAVPAHARDGLVQVGHNLPNVTEDGEQNHAHLRR